MAFVCRSPTGGAQFARRNKRVLPMVFSVNGRAPNVEGAVISTKHFRVLLRPRCAHHYWSQHRWDRDGCMDVCDLMFAAYMVDHALRSSILSHRIGNCAMEICRWRVALSAVVERWTRRRTMVVLKAKPL